MENSPYLLINELVVQGVDNSYKFSFKEGLNFIWGDMDSGKSSILNLIDYCLGGKNERLLYAEMKKHGRTALLEANLNGQIFTFERDIHSASSPIRVYSGPIDSRSTNFPRIMSANPSDNSSLDGWISDFILDNLGIPKVAIKESRYRDNADSDRLSFRDLMKLLYLKQTRIGSDSLLDFLSGALFNKNVEIQKFVFNIYDDQLTQLARELAAATNALSELEKNEKFIRRFLSDIEIDPTRIGILSAKVEGNVHALQEIDADIQLVKSDFDLSSSLAQELTLSVDRLTQQLKSVRQKQFAASKKYENFVRLSNTYSFDLQALKTSQIARKYVGQNHKHGDIPCPLCSSPVSISSQTIDESDIEIEIKSLRNRISGVDEVLAKIRQDQLHWAQEEEGLVVKLADAKRSFDEANVTYLSPLVSSIQALEIARSQLKIDLAEAEKNSRIANKYEEVNSKIDAQSALVSSIRRAIKIAQEGLVGLDTVVQSLTALFKSYLAKSGLQNNHGGFIDNRFIPYFRNTSYYVTSSGGVRTIVSIGSFLVRLRYILEIASNLPTFLMIDTPGQNIGRYRSQEDLSEVSDPKLYENIFAQIQNIVQYARKHSRKCQVIVVDNDLPETLRSSSDFHLVKRFNKQGGGSDKGLISDAT